MNIKTVPIEKALRRNARKKALISLPKDIYGQFKDACKDKGCTMSYVVEKYARLFISAHGKVKDKSLLDIYTANPEPEVFVKLAELSGYHPKEIGEYMGIDRSTVYYYINK